MGDIVVSDILRDAVMVGARVAAPILLISMAIGLIISIFQAATQIHEQTLTFVPKLLIIIIVLLAGGSWMLGSLVELSRQIFSLMLG
jgi:flagellar biosynthetic protein FliQ